MDEKMLNMIGKVRVMFTSYGIRSVTMDDVARELGISKKTLYQHFADKNDLVRQVIMQQLAAMDQEFRMIVSKRLGALETFLQIAESISRFVVHFNPSISFDLMKYYPEIWTVLLNYKRDRVFNYIKENLLIGMREGLYRRDMDVEVIGRLYVSRIKSGMDKEVSPQPPLDFDKFFREVITYHIRGIASKKGLEEFERISKENKLFQEG